MLQLAEYQQCADDWLDTLRPGIGSVVHKQISQGASLCQVCSEGNGLMSLCLRIYPPSPLSPPRGQHPSSETHWGTDHCFLVFVKMDSKIIHRKPNPTKNRTTLTQNWSHTEPRPTTSFSKIAQNKKKLHWHVSRTTTHAWNTQQHSQTNYGQQNTTINAI